MEKIIIIGASGHAKVIADIIEKNGKYEIFGFIDTYKQIGTKILGYQVIGDVKLIPYLMEKEGIKKGIIAIGDNWLRKGMFIKIKTIVPDFDFISAIHPSASISNFVLIKKGTVVMAGAVVNADSQIGAFSIVNTKASLGHDSIMQEYSSLSSGVVVGGNVTIGKFTSVSIGATIVNNSSIGKHTVIGAGSVVTQNIGDFQIAYGIPAKFIRKRNKGEDYLRTNGLK